MIYRSKELHKLIQKKAYEIYRENLPEWPDECDLAWWLIAERTILRAYADGSIASSLGSDTEEVLAYMDFLEYIKHHPSGLYHKSK